jgi:ankyrin repeat protein
VNERGNTPLHDAARWSCIDLVHLLLENDAPLNVRNLQGLIPLHMAKVFETCVLSILAAL